MFQFGRSKFPLTVVSHSCVEGRPQNGKCLWSKRSGKSQNGPKTKLRVLLESYTLSVEIGKFCTYPLIIRGVKT